MKEQTKKIKSCAGAVALGFFDGIHLGHRAVIGSMLKSAGENSLMPRVYTFKKSPSAFFGREASFITANEERYSILREMGVESVFEDDFPKVKDLSPEGFVRRVVVEKLNAKKVFCGFNYHFGKGGTGDSRELSRICSKFGTEVTVVPPVIAEGRPVSSTRIRQMLRDGDIEGANRLLSRRFGYSSVIERGNRIGRLMDTPTINQQLPRGMVIPKFGVYTSLVTVDGKVHTGVTNIGVKPTVGEYEPLSETWLPEYKGGSLYGKNIDVRLVCFHRPEIKFSSIRELEKAIKRDGMLAAENVKKLKNFSSLA